MALNYEGFPYIEGGLTPFPVTADPAYSHGGVLEHYDRGKHLNGLEIDPRVLGAVGYSTPEEAASDDAVDSTAVFQGIFDNFGARGVTIRLSRGCWFKIAAQSGTVDLPYDNGTLPGGSSITPETPEQMPYSLALPDHCNIVADDRWSCGLVGGWDGTSVSLGDLIMFTTKTGAGRDNRMVNLSIRSAFIGFYARPGTTLARWILDNVTFRACAFPWLTDKLERCQFAVHFELCWAGLVNGGQWLYRYNGPQEASWSDKSIFWWLTFGDVPWASGNSTLLDRRDALDAFYDANFYKSDNEGTRGGPPVGGVDTFARNPYTGVCGIPLCLFSRYGRLQYVNYVGTIFARQAIRAALLIGSPTGGRCENIHAEDFGWDDPLGGWNIETGIDRVDPYHDGPARGVAVIFPLTTGNTRISFQFGSINPVKARATKGIWVRSDDPADSWASNVGWDMLAGNQGVGGIDVAQPLSQFRGAIWVRDFMLPTGTAIDIGADATPFNTTFTKQVRTGAPLGVGHTGAANPGLLGEVHYLNYNPGGAWQDHTYNSGDLAPALQVPSGCWLVQVSHQRGEGRAGGGAWIVTPGSVSEIAPFTAEGPDGYTADIALTVFEDGSMQFAFTSNWNNVTNGELVVMVTGVGGFYSNL